MTSFVFDPRATAAGTAQAFSAAWPGLGLWLDHASNEFYKGSGHDALPDDQPIGSKAAATAVSITGDMTPDEVNKAVYAGLGVECMVHWADEEGVLRYFQPGETLDAVSSRLR